MHTTTSNAKNKSRSNWIRALRKSIIILLIACTILSSGYTLYLVNHELTHLQISIIISLILLALSLLLFVTTNIFKDQQTIIGATHVIRDIHDDIKASNDLRESYEKLNADVEMLKERNEKMSLLLEMSDVMLASSEIKELSDIIAKYCGKVLNFTSGLFYIMHSSKNYLEVSSSWGNPHAQSNYIAADKCWSLRTGHIYDANITDTELICDHVKHRNGGQFSYLCIPLRAKNDIYGLLYIEIEYHDNQVVPISYNDRILINTFTKVSSLALANIRLRDNLLHQSMRDPLTSLYNRRYLQEFLTKLIYQSERSKSNIAILMMDVDHFKKINDVYGHDAGDIVLKELSQLFINHIRPGDLAARYGGEEFIIVLYDTDQQSAKSRAEKLCHTASVLIIKYGAQVTGSITLSIGVAVYPHDGLTSSQLIETADKALYFAKNTGRNKVVMCSDIPEEFHF